MRYAVSVYNLNNITAIRDSELQFSISDFEVLLLKIRGQTIKFSSHNKGQWTVKSRF